MLLLSVSLYSSSRGVRNPVSLYASPFHVDSIVHVFPHISVGKIIHVFSTIHHESTSIHDEVVLPLRISVLQEDSRISPETTGFMFSPELDPVHSIGSVDPESMIPESVTIVPVDSVTGVEISHTSSVIAILRTTLSF